MSFWAEKRILVTGGSGFLGSRVVQSLRNRGAVEISMPLHSDYDLRDRDACRQVVQGQDLVIHLAARVGGIGLNSQKPGELFFDNILLSTLLMEEARLAGVQKYVAPGTICSYPKYTPVPFSEDDLWSGYPEETNAAYGLARKMQLVQAQAYRQQYGFKAVCPLLANLYGPGDNFDPESSHVIPALIKKIFDATKAGDKSVTIWGTGEATRDFLYVDDAAEAIMLAAEFSCSPEPVNIGSGKETTINELANLIIEIIGYKGRVIWDRTKPDGQPRRMVDTTRAQRDFGFSAKVSLREGLLKTIDQYHHRQGTPYG